MAPGSLLYGSDAVGGTVNAAPMRRDHRGETSWERRVFLRFASAELSLIGRAQISGNVEDDVGFVSGASGAAFDDLDGGGEVSRHDGTELEGILDEVHVRASWQRLEETQDRVRGDGRRNLSGFEVETFGIALELVSRVSIVRLTCGADYHPDSVDSSR